MQKDHLQNFDDAVDRIKRQQAISLSCYAFLLGIVNNSDRSAKYKNSFAGHAIDLCIRNTETCLALFCDRHWDSGNDSQSIPTANKYAELAKDEIVNRHRIFFSDNDIDRDADLFYKYLQDLSFEVDAAKKSAVRTQIRVIRTENYAHLISTSQDRENALIDNPSFDPALFTAVRRDCWICNPDWTVGAFSWFLDEQGYDPTGP